MERIAVCAVCGKNIARFTCMKCGSYACRDCFMPEKQLCKKCLLTYRGKAKKLF